jgi:lysozyme
VKTSDLGLEFLKKNESVKREMYRDQVGLPTIGVGHLLTKSELSSGKIQLGGEPIKWRNGLTDAQIDAILEADISHVEFVINAYVHVWLTQPQLDALVSFVFNIGAEAFAKSTLLELLNRGNFDAVPDQMRRWIHNHEGQVLPVLVERRNREIAMWEEAA